MDGKGWLKTLCELHDDAVWFKICTLLKLFYVILYAHNYAIDADIMYIYSWVTISHFHDST